VREFIVEFLRYVREHRVLWLVPLVILALLIGLVLFLSPEGALAPFMYRR
jgi:hypothetical protein